MNKKSLLFNVTLAQLAPLMFAIVIAIASFLPTASYAQSSIFDISNSSLLSNDDEFLTVDQAFVFNFDQENQKLHISFEISEGYYLYRHQFKFSSENAQLATIDLPQGIDHEDEFFGVQQIYTQHLSFIIDIQQAADNATVSIRYQGCAEKGLCYPPTKKTITIDPIKKALAANSATVLSALASADDTTTSTLNEQANVSEQHQLADMLKQDSLLLTLVAFFVGGLLLSFTPCVFPMYPILTGIIVGAGQQSEPLSTKKAFALSFFYVQGMAITYTLLGIIVALAGAQFQAMFQHPVVLIGLSALFIFLALSMFGVFNLALPASWQNKLNNLSNKQQGGSITGVVAMGVISGLVASPCTTAPLTGALLYISQTGNIILGASALYALSLGMGVPLLIIGSSGGKLLPKAGSWMNVIKNVFGLLLLAVPIFLLERLLPEKIGALLWLMLALSSFVYFIRVNQTTKHNLAYGLRFLGILALLVLAIKATVPSLLPTESLDNNSQPHTQFIAVDNLKALKQAVAQANLEGKTVMVDLYADWCIACKEFEKYTFSEKSVQQALANSVLIQIDLTDTNSKESVELMEHYNIYGLPSILFFDLHGVELSQQRVTGFMGAEEFSAHINKLF